MQDVCPTQAIYSVPWFVIKKIRPDGKENIKLITDCRDINQHLHPRPFRLDAWAQISPVLRKGQWGAKINLKNTNFHLALSQKLAPFSTLQGDQQFFQFPSANFGLSTLPRIWQKVVAHFWLCGEPRASKFFATWMTNCCCNFKKEGSA